MDTMDYPETGLSLDQLDIPEYLRQRLRQADIVDVDRLLCYDWRMLLGHHGFGGSEGVARLERALDKHGLQLAEREGQPRRSPYSPLENAKATFELDANPFGVEPLRVAMLAGGEEILSARYDELLMRALNDGAELVLPENRAELAAQLRSLADQVEAWQAPEQAPE